MKYKIVLGGRGADIYIHKINKEQHKLLKEGQVEVNQMEYEEIAKVLNSEEVDITDDIYTGLYWGSSAEDFQIEVFDETDKIVFDSLSTEKWYFDENILMEYENYDSVFDEDIPLLIVESYSKGTFFNFELETEDFDPKKLSPVITEINERFELITGLCYEGVELNYEFGDYWGKGYYYHLT